MPLFSVIIPTYNRLPLLMQALESVWRQTITDYEVIIVDDGSTDGTWEQLQLLGSRVRSVRQQNLGPGAARNLGAKLATGEYLAFLDSDDVWFPWTLATYTEIIQQHGSPAFIAGKPFRFEQDGQLAGISGGRVRSEGFADYYASGDEWRWWGASSFVVSTDAYHSVGGFTDQSINGEDADLAMRLGMSSGFVQVCAPCTFGYRNHAISAMKNHRRTLDGVWHKVRAEQSGQYPGGQARAADRWRILSRHVRPVTLECLRGGLRDEAWRLYRATFRWHLKLGRWKYLTGFPAMAMLRYG